MMLSESGLVVLSAERSEAWPSPHRKQKIPLKANLYYLLEVNFEQEADTTVKSRSCDTDPTGS